MIYTSIDSSKRIGQLSLKLPNWLLRNLIYILIEYKTTNHSTVKYTWVIIITIVLVGRFETAVAQSWTTKWINRGMVPSNRYTGFGD